MREEQRLFLAQAKSAFAVYRFLNAEQAIHHCHSLHYLQMATELLGKANAWKQGPPGEITQRSGEFSPRPLVQYQGATTTRVRRAK